MFKFSIVQKDKQSKARAGELVTPHGIIKTPNFNPVGTQASVKALSSRDLKEMGAQIVLANTYHLHLRPGENVVKELGGLGKFMSWDGPTMTDSGGYQVFSLGSAQVETEDGKKLHKFSSTGSEKHVTLERSENAAIESQRKNIGDPIAALQDDKLLVIPENEAFIEEARLGARKTQPIKPAKMDEKGVTFYSHLDGTEHRLDPQIAVAMQEAIGADLIVAFDDHESPLWNYEQTKASLERTNRWGIESLQAQKRKDQLMYGVVHGGMFEDLRVESAKFTDKHFAAISIGGSYTTKDLLYKTLALTTPHFAEDKPRHLLGIGEIQDLFHAIERGIDFFDCVAPTRRGRHGNFYIHPETGGTVKQNFTLQITSAKFITDQEPIDPLCKCYVCQNFTRGYINHLFKAGELLGQHLGSYHNVYFIVNLVQEIRQAILDEKFQQMKSHWLG